MEYKYEDIDTLEQLRDIVLKEINEKANDVKFVKMALSYMAEIIEELGDPNENVAKCNEIIEEVVTFLNKANYGMKCPMCEEDEMKHIEYNGTHIYVCEPCPFVGFELVDNEDIVNMIEWLEGEK